MAELAHLVLAQCTQRHCGLIYVITRFIFAKLQCIALAAPFNYENLLQSFFYVHLVLISRLTQICPIPLTKSINFRLPTIGLAACAGKLTEYIKSDPSAFLISRLTDTDRATPLLSLATKATRRPQQSLPGGKTTVADKQPTFGPGANPWG